MCSGRLHEAVVLLSILASRPKADSVSFRYSPIPKWEEVGGQEVQALGSTHWTQNHLEIREQGDNSGLVAIFQAPDISLAHLGNDLGMFVDDFLDSAKCAASNL